MSDKENEEQSRDDVIKEIKERLTRLFADPEKNLTPEQQAELEPVFQNYVDQTVAELDSEEPDSETD